MAARPALSRDLPWIGCGDPWAILVAEVMLQQTSTARVEGPWRSFLGRFPTPGRLAEAPLADALRAWSGLGYPRRVQRLAAAAREIVERFAGQVPADPAVLRTLPGIGEYTASAVASFAYGHPVAVLDTNVGRVLARSVANRRLSRPEARDLARELLGDADSAAHNQTMIDLGARFCRATPRCAECPMSAVCAFHLEGGEDPAPVSAAVSRRQAPYAGSDRQARGRILSVLAAGPAHRDDVARRADVERDRAARLLADLVAEELCERREATFALKGEW